MKGSWKGTIIKYLAAIAFCGLMILIYVSSRDLVAASRLEKYRIWCDAFTIPGLLLIFTGLLVWVANQGALDGISYALKGMFRVFIPGAGLRQNLENYHDYLQRKKERRVKGYGFLFLTGGASLLVALVFLYLFYRIY